jgi:1-acyl-sn-glycerol-3-phosphate acyltransferase
MRFSRADMPPILARDRPFAYRRRDSNTLRMLQRLAHLILRLGGWTPVGELPDVPRALFIAAPHTSNWDGLWLLTYKVALNIRLHFLAKHTLFWWPLGPVLRALGALPIDRTASTSTVQQVIDEFATRERFWFALSPEGTRKSLPYWKTGFYRIAEAADVPLVLGFIDYGKRQMGIGITLPPERNLDVDLELMRDFYAPLVGRVPANAGAVAFPPDFVASRTGKPR